MKCRLACVLIALWGTVASALPPYVIEELPAYSIPPPAVSRSSYGSGRTGADRIRSVLDNKSTSRVERQRALRALRLYGKDAEPVLDAAIASHSDDPAWAGDIAGEGLFLYANVRYLPYLLRCLGAERDEMGVPAASTLIARVLESDRHFRYGPDPGDVYGRIGGSPHVQMVSRLGIGDRDRVLDAVQRVLARKDISERRRKICDSLAKVITDQMAEEQAEVTKRLAAKAARAALDAATRAANGE